MKSKGTGRRKMYAVVVLGGGLAAMLCIVAGAKPSSPKYGFLTGQVGSKGVAHGRPEEVYDFVVDEFAAWNGEAERELDGKGFLELAPSDAGKFRKYEIFLLPKGEQIVIDAHTTSTGVGRVCVRVTGESPTNPLEYLKAWWKRVHP